MTNAWSVHEIYWYSPSGWVVDSVSHEAWYNGPDQKYAYFIGNSAFSNHPFCYPGITHNTYRPNRIIAMNDGTALFYLVPNNWGGCSSLLHFRYTQSYQ